MELLIVVVTWAILEEELAKAAVAEVPSDQLEVLLERCKLKEKRSIFIKKHGAFFWCNAGPRAKFSFSDPEIIIKQPRKLENFQAKYLKELNNYFKVDTVKS
ncbi:uncharacterized protein isoform X4 [Rhodnius prolixus]|uniref:uncharacterized protein isoform X4 n=1 Tax=Rhodnius prolixus TaxID=13249 RepID=UPI003D18BA0C